MRRQPQFETKYDRESEVNRYMWRYALRVVGYVIAWVLIFIGSMVAIGWIAANGRQYHW